MTYQEYIASSAWKAKRAQRLEIDGNRCVVCKSGDDLSVHHLHYDNFGDEDPLYDLVTACERCHPYFDEIERFQRYQKRNRSADLIDLKIRDRKDITYGMARSEVQIDIGLPNADAQRTESRSNQQMGKVDQADFVKARQNRY